MAEPTNNLPPDLMEFTLDDASLYVRLGYRKEEAEAVVGLSSILADRYRRFPGSHSVLALASSLGVRVEDDSWMTADDRILMLGECSWEPHLIRVNQRVVVMLSGKARSLGLNGMLFGPDSVRDSVIAHELYHIISRKPAGRLIELEAHSFARSLLSMEYSPLIYDRMLGMNSVSGIGKARYLSSLA